VAVLRTGVFNEGICLPIALHPVPIDGIGPDARFTRNGNRKDSIQEEVGKKLDYAYSNVDGTLRQKGHDFSAVG